VLFYSDGSPKPDGPTAARSRPKASTLRRLRHAIVAEQPGALIDDATALLIEWNRGAEAKLLPPTVDRSP
jgi:hypothetical protein